MNSTPQDIAQGKDDFAQHMMGEGQGRLSFAHAESTADIPQVVDKPQRGRNEMNVSEMKLEDLADGPPAPFCNCADCRSVRIKTRSIRKTRKQFKSLDGQRSLFSDDIYRTPKKKCSHSPPPVVSDVDNSTATDTSSKVTSTSNK
jgi:hypothetical protein